MKKQIISPMDAVSSIESYLEDLVAKFPKMPEKAVETIVSIAPWLTILGLIMLVPVALTIFGIGAFFAPFAMMGGFRYDYPFISGIGGIVTIILYATALSGLFARQKSAWDKMFWAYLVGLIVNVLNFEIGSFVISGLIGAYVLFSVKKHYK